MANDCSVHHGCDEAVHCRCSEPPGHTGPHQCACGHRWPHDTGEAPDGVR